MPYKGGLKQLLELLLARSFAYKLRNLFIHFLDFLNGLNIILPYFLVVFL
jgi:hypothetical protein